MTDDDLRERLLRLDPGASLPGLDPDTTSRLMEDAMTTTSSAPTTTGRWRVLLAAALVVAVAGAGWILAGRFLSGEPGTPSAPGADRVVRLTSSQVWAKCREPEASTLAASADFAFAGAVKAVAGPVVTFTVTRIYRGQTAAEVQVELDGRSESLTGGGPARVGMSYLISSANGALLGCGYSGEVDSPGLQLLFSQAF